MRIGTQDVTAGTTYTCDKCDDFTLRIHGLPQMLIVADHFGAHITGAHKVMAHTLDAARRQA